ncbi:MAG TPA: T9SS type A sorting domain-containing protein [Candidatus Kapabacteria bacterium]|nr:T9SS type A sorting domain-containing protein [Candidatus Kapabacteria bacterium]
MGKIFSTIMIMCACTMQLFAQNNYWQSTSGPTQSGNYFIIKTLISSPVNNDVFAVGGNGLFRTTDNGTSWSELYDSSFTILLAGVDKNGVLYAATYFGHPDSLIRSTDNGETWQALLYLHGTPLESISSLLFTDNGTMYMGTDSGLYYSTDNGGTWSFNSGLGSISISHLAKDDAGNIFAEATSGSSVLFRSSNNGSSWTLVGSGLFNGQDQGTVSCFASNATRFYAGTGNGVYVSVDSGLTWSSLYNHAISPTNVYGIAIDAQGNVFAASDYGIYASSDSGTTWSVIDQGLTTSIQSPGGTALTINADDYLFAATSDSGVYRSINKTERGYQAQNFWEPVDGPTYIYNNYDSTGGRLPGVVVPGIVSSILVARDGSILATIQGSGDDYYLSELMRSTDGGNSWQADTNGIMADTMYLNDYYWKRISALAIAPNGDIYAGGEGLYRSTDNGVSWKGLPNVTGTLNDEYHIYKLVIDPSGNMLAGVLDSLFRSTDKGNTWTAVGQGLPRPQHFENTSLTVNMAGDLFATSLATYDGVYRSTDDGFTWIAANYGLSKGNDLIYSIATGVGGYLFAGTDYSFYSSPNNGLTWNAITSMGNMFPYSIGVDTSNNLLFLCTKGSNATVFRSSDNGTDWVVAVKGMPDSARNINCYAFDQNGRAFVGTNFGVYRSVRQCFSDYGTTSLTTDIVEQKISAQSPSSLALTAFPNPTLMQTTFEYTLPNQTAVTLTISDVMGRTLATLLDGVKHNPGVYRVNYSASQLKAGIYFCTLRAGNLIQTTRLLKIR